ncbi:MAG: outer membrane lipoprotein carrier protein LolA [Gemmatimonadales bacterium]
MRRALSLLLLGCSLSVVPLAAQTADEIVARALTARGGLNRIKAIHAERITGTITFGPNEPGLLRVAMRRPAQAHEEVALPNGLMVRWTDGKGGWIIQPGGTAPRALSPGELENMAGSTDFDGPVVDAAAKGNIITLVGKDSVEGRAAWKLKVTGKDSAVHYIYFDAGSFLQVKWEGIIHGANGDYSVASYFHDYRPVNGVMFSYSIDSGSDDAPGAQKIRLTTVEVDPVLDDSLFRGPR